MKSQKKNSLMRNESMRESTQMLAAGSLFYLALWGKECKHWECFKQHGFSPHLSAGLVGETLLSQNFWMCPTEVTATGFFFKNFLFSFTLKCQIETSIFVWAKSVFWFQVLETKTFQFSIFSCRIFGVSPSFILKCSPFFPPWKK